MPEKVVELLVEVNSYSRLRDLYVKIPFAHKKAVKCSKKAERLRNQAWSEVYAVYPELRRVSNLTMNHDITEIWENLVILLGSLGYFFTRGYFPTHLFLGASFGLWMGYLREWIFNK